MTSERMRTFLLVALAVFFTAASPVRIPGAENMKITMGVHFMSSLGQSSSQLFDTMKTLSRVVNDKYGVEIVLKTYPSFNDVEDAFLKNEIDAAMIWTGQVGAIPGKGGIMHPWGTFQVKKTKKAALCLWQKRGAKISNIGDASGKSLISASYTVDGLIFLRDYLYRNGVDKPLWNVFRSFTIVRGENSAFMAIAAGDADFFWTANDYETILKFIAPNVENQVSYSLCSDAVYGRGGFVLNRKRVSEGELKKLDETLLKFLKGFNELAKTDAGIKATKQFLNLAQVRIAPARPDEYDYEIKLFNEARKRGWVREAEFIVDLMDKAQKGKAVEIKPDFDYCKNACAPGKSQMACIDKCME